MAQRLLKILGASGLKDLPLDCVRIMRATSKKLARGLMNCNKNEDDMLNSDELSPGVIFTDLNETLWTVTEAEQQMVVDRILDFKKRPDEPPAAAQFLCGKLYAEFGVFPSIQENHASASSIGMHPNVVGCAKHLYDHNYDVTFALEHILQDKSYFRDTLGQVKRWPLSMILGPVIDMNINTISSNTLRKWAGKVGMTPFEPQDVSGFDLDSVWTSDRLSSAHDFLDRMVGPVAKNEDDVSDFKTLESFHSKFARYNMGPTHPSKYSYSVRLCGPDFFVDVVGMKGNHTIDTNKWFGTGDMLPDPNQNSKWKRRRVWKASVKFAVTNVCQFVC